MIKKVFLLFYSDMKHLLTQTLPFIAIPHLTLVAMMASIITSFATLSMHIWFTPILILPYLGYCIRKRNTTNIIMLICALISSCLVQQKIKSLTYHFDNHKDFLNQPVTIYGTILNKNHINLGSDQVTVTIQINNIKNQKQYTSFHQKIYVIGQGKKIKNVLEGQYIKISDIVLQQPKKDTEFYQYMLKEQLWATAFITSQKITVYNRQTHYARSCLNRFAQFLQYPTLQLFEPLFLGKKNKNVHNAQMQHQSTYLGIAHHMARSGIHLIAILGLILTILHFLRISYLWQYLIITILAFFYLHISFLSTSFLRAFCMFGVQILSKTNKLTYSSMHALNLTCLILILHNPFYALFLDFQLSFGITAAVIWLFQIKRNQTIDFSAQNIIHSSLK